jgi:hypothetical protein
MRRKAGIDFSGWDATTSWLIAKVQTTVWGFSHGSV